MDSNLFYEILFLGPLGIITLIYFIRMIRIPFHLLRFELERNVYIHEKHLALHALLYSLGKVMVVYSIFASIVVCIIEQHGFWQMITGSLTIIGFAVAIALVFRTLYRRVLRQGESVLNTS